MNQIELNNAERFKATPVSDWLKYKEDHAHDAHSLRAVNNFLKVYGEATLIFDRPDIDYRNNVIKAFKDAGWQTWLFDNDNKLRIYYFNEQEWIDECNKHLAIEG